MRAELVLRIAADPNAVGTLTSNELCELLAEAKPPAWAFEEASRRTGDDRVLAHMVSHPQANSEVLENALSFNTIFLNRLKHHVKVYKGEQLELTAVFAHLVPEELTRPLNDLKLERLLASHLPPLCLKYLLPAVRDPRALATSRKRVSSTLLDEDECVFLEVSPEKLDIPRGYSPLARFILLGDFVYHLECKPVATPNDLPIMAKVALALNSKQPIEPYLSDADVRVRRAAKERATWTEN